MHYQRARRDASRQPKPTISQRFWSKVDTSGDCWVWTASLSENGYGRFSVNNYPEYAHIWAWEERNGSTPDGMQLDHTCRNTRCVRPDHLEPVPARVNNMRSNSASAQNARKTHCVNGHEFTPANTYVRPDNGGRQCRACTRQREQLDRAEGLAGHAPEAWDPANRGVPLVREVAADD